MKTLRDLCLAPGDLLFGFQTTFAGDFVRAYALLVIEVTETKALCMALSLAGETRAARFHPPYSINLANGTSLSKIGSLGGV